MDFLKSYYEISPFFFTVTASASLLFSVSNLSFLISGADSGEPGNVSEHLPSDVSFKFFTTQTLLAFLMGFGWAGMTSTLRWGLGLWVALIIGFSFGVLLMLFNAFLLYQISKLNQTRRANLYTALGSRATVYREISEATQGIGQVQVVISGQQKIVDAISSEASLNSFSEVEVIGVKDNRTLIVRPIIKINSSSGEQ